MRKGLQALLLAVTLMLATGLSANATQPTGHKVDICHATASETNPYVLINVDIASAGYPDYETGHASHEGDIIPPYTYEEFSFPGQGDQSILENGCGVVNPDPDPNPSPDPEPDPDPTPPPPVDRCDRHPEKCQLPKDLAFTGLSGTAAFGWGIGLLLLGLAALRAVYRK